MKKRYLLLPCLLLSFALAACGSSGGDSSVNGDTQGGGDDEAQVVATIESTLTEPSPATCTETETEAFVEQTMQASGDAAIKACEEDGEEATAESVEISNVAVDGSDATAEVAFASGSFDGQTLVIALVKDGGGWKLDNIDRFAKIDRDALVESFEEEIEGLSPEQTDCITEGLSDLPQEAFESFLLDGDTGALTELAESCA